ncbi:MAG: 3-methyl-2-oxobutanoate hydroxymethyltransferase [Anaerolineales bacterium]|nr:3-methyl-2-oxobutanoate hydroxymethyltransferase [Anaerolineales bacterium]MCS7247711.1 3-methyl-2-oxobutanoate hydroxymethyltransferase [Anaerolineales bacterium]MDW8161521.1 3-methyl-2-oxobutanoate hydroxymethyltransferase [Anaerolineales bacterium]MDW8446857.1 3-methyl-2-oxobutanoate hydroxymethyltransferase [Anaerolineales bacterium]
MSIQLTPSQLRAVERKKITLPDLRQKKEQGRPITMLTAYDYPTAKAIDEAGVDVILVGDSLGMVVLGYPNTLQVTMEDMLHHCRAVARGAKTALLVGDMPFLSYQVSTQEAVRNAGRFLQEGGMEAVKLEGGRERAETIRAIVAAGIPVMGHLGLTPQSIHQLGGFRAQGRHAEAALRLLEDALVLQEAGCFSLVLESVPRQLAAYITQHLEIPTIGIGAGEGCDGQVLVTHDLLGLFDRFTPRFAKQYAQLYSTMRTAFAQYVAEVQAGLFPDKEHSLEMSEAEWRSFLQQAATFSPGQRAETSLR